MEETRWQDIYMKLKEKGIKVYSPAQKTGQCRENYVVVANAGTTQFQQYSSTITLYDVMCYVPEGNHSELEIFVSQVKTAMEELEPMIRDNHYETAEFYDDTVKAHMISLQYKNYRKM